jgi:hypothetical protein
MIHFSILILVLNILLFASSCVALGHILAAVVRKDQKYFLKSLFWFVLLSTAAYSSFLFLLTIL